MHVRPKSSGLATTCAVLALMIGLLPLSAADLCQSRPVNINNAEFVLVASDKWIPGQPAQLELRIKNLASEKTVFPLFDTVRVELTDSKGMPVSCGGSRRATNMVPPMVVLPGQTGVAKFKASATMDSEGVRFNFEDGTGTVCISPALKPGTLRASLNYSNKSTAAKSAGGRIWIGDASTEDVEIRLSDGGEEPEKPAVPGSAGGSLAAPGFQ